MKKIKKSIAVFAVVLMMSSGLNVFGSPGGASQCAQQSRSYVLALAANNGHDPNGEYFQFYISIYNSIYLICYNNEQ